MTTETLNVLQTGILRFLGWFYPWKLISPDTATESEDLFPSVISFFERNNGKRMVMKQCVATGISLEVNPKGSYRLKYENDKQKNAYRVLLAGDLMNLEYSNIIYHLTNCLQGINGQTVTVEITDNCLSFRADPDQDLPEVYISGSGNACLLTKEQVFEWCRPGSDNTCAFLTVGGDGFECCKFSSLAAGLLNRIGKNAIRAKRIGDCRIIPRPE